MLEHGGRLLQAVSRYGLPREQWLDLSTGVNPSAWQGTPIPIASWSRLPEDEDGLSEAAGAYYGTSSLLPVSGSQAAIQALPRLRGAPSRVGVPFLGYNEHGYRWQRAGHDVMPLETADFEAALPNVDVLVVSNPNNPTGARWPPETLLRWHEQLSVKGGWLVVDEAFGDCQPEATLAPYARDREGLVVLRSLGKFFGLAGARVGFVAAAPALLDALAAGLGPWTVAGPSRWVAQGALRDRAWQESTRRRLRQDSRRLAELLAAHALSPSGGCELFQWVRLARAPEVHEALARRGVLTRLFTKVPSIRFGLPASEHAWQRLEDVLRP